MFESESLLVQVPSPEYLLAMKLHASRDDRDVDDAALLFNWLSYSTARKCIDLLTVTYPTGQLLPRHRYVPRPGGHTVSRTDPRIRPRHSPRAMTAPSGPGAVARSMTVSPSSRKVRVVPSSRVIGS